MKKFIVAILALLYITTSVGATVNIHYCMGKLADWSIGYKQSKSCGKCGMEKSAKKSNGCCKDENKFIKNNTDQKTTAAGFQIPPFSTLTLPVSFFEVPAPNTCSITNVNPISDAPPIDSGVAIYIRICVFLI